MLEIPISTSKARSEADKLDKSLSSLGSRAQKTKDEFGRFTTENKSAERSMKSLQSASSGVSSALKMVYGTLAAYGALRVAKNIIDVASSFEQLQISLDTITKGKGAEWFEKLNEWALKMPVNTQKAIDVFRQMQAMGLQPTIEMMTTLVDTMGALGGSADTLEGIARALGQIETKGKVSAEELMQLAERGVPAYQILQKQLGLTAAQVGDIGRQGIDAHKAVMALFAGMEERFGGMSAKMQTTWQGLTESIKSYWAEFVRKMMDTGPFDFLKAQLKSFVDKLDELRAKGILDQWAKEVAVVVINSFSAMVKAAEMFLQTLNNIKTVWAGISNLGNQIEMNKLIAERDAIVNRLDEGFWNKFVFGSVGEEESRRLKIRLKDITSEMEKYSSSMLDNTKTIENASKTHEQIEKNFGAIRTQLEKSVTATKSATTSSVDFKSTTEALTSTVSFLNDTTSDLNTTLDNTGGSLGGVTKGAKKAQEALQNLNYEYYKSLAAARGLSDPELSYAEGMTDAAKRSADILKDLADTEAETQKEAAEESARQWDLFANDVRDNVSDIFFDMMDGQVTGWEDMLDKVGDFFKRTFADLASWLVTQKFVMPVMAQMVNGLGGVVPGGAMSAMGLPTGQGGGFQMPGMGGMGFGTPSWWNSPIFGSTPQPGWAPGGPTAGSSGLGFSWGQGITGIGGLASMGMGAYGLANGNYLGGASGIIGGGLMGASALGLGAILGPIGAAVSALGTLLGGLINTSDPGIRLNAGKSFGADLFDINYKDVDVSDSEKAGIKAGVQGWFDAWESEFKVNWVEVLANVPYDFKASLDSSDLEEVGDMAARWGDDMLRELGGYLSENIFGTMIPGSDSFIKGLTGMSDLRAMGEGDLTKLIEGMFAPLYALQEAGTDIDQMFTDLRDMFGDPGAGGVWNNEVAVEAQRQLGAWFQSMQASGEEISATVARVISTLATVPDGMDRLTALVDSGLNMKEAYEKLEKQLTVTQALVTAPVENMITTAMQTLDFSQAKTAFMDGVKQMMVSSIMTSFSQDILDSVIKAAFDPLGGLTDAIEAAIEDKDYSSLGDKFTEALDAIGPAIDELQPKFQDLFDLIEKLGSTVDSTVPSDPTGSNKITAAMSAALAASLNGEKWEDVKAAFTGSLNDLLKDTLGNIWVKNMVDMFSGAISDATGSVFAGGLQGLMTAYFEGTITSSDFDKYISEFWEKLGPILDEMEPKFRAMFEALGMVSEGTDSAVNSLADMVEGYQDIVSGDDFTAKMRDLQRWREDEIDKIEALGLSSSETAAAINELNRATDAQADAIRNDLLQAIYEAEQATRDWAYSLQTAIDALSGGANAATLAFDSYNEALARSRDDSLSTDNRIGAINDAKRYLDEYVSSSISAIQATHQARIDQLNAERQAIQDNSQAEQDAIRNLYEGRIDALQTERDALQDASDARIEALQAEKDAQTELFNAQIEAAQEQLDLARAWKSTLESVRDVILSISTGNLNPADQFEQLAIQQSEVDRLRQLYATSTGAEQAAYGSELARAIQGELSMANEAYLGPSGEYTKIYEDRMDELQAIQEEAVAQAVDTDAIQRHIEELNEQRNSILKGIDNQIKTERDTLKTVLDSIDSQIDAQRGSMEAALKSAQESNDAALASIDASIAAEQAAMEAEVAAFKASVIPLYETLLNEGVALHKDVEDNLKDQLYWLEQIYNAITGLNTIIDSGSVTGATGNDDGSVVSGGGTVGARSYANEGRVTRPTLAVIGDAPVPEWVLRETTIKALLDGGSRRDGGVVIEIGNINVPAGVNGRQFANDFTRQLKSNLDNDESIRQSVKRAAK